MKDTHAVAILTEWDEFKSYDWEKVYNQMFKPAFIFDGRGILDIQSLSELGFKLFRIGK
jgi:UDPglucose 6-dehydrogenase